MRHLAPVAVAALAVATGACATVPVDETFERARRDAAARVGQPPERLEWADVSAPAAEIEERVDQLLAEPLDADRAVQVALLADPRLQAAWADLARAEATRVQAGLPGNPFFEVVARWRDGGGRPQLELSVVQEVLDLFLLPARRRLAAVELERAEVELASTLVDRAAAARAVFLRYQAERQLLELDRHALLAVEAAWEMAARLREAGNVTELDLLVERDLYEQVKLETAARELAVADLREQVNARLGLWGERAARWRAAERLPEPPAEGAAPIDAAALERQAVERSLELAGALLDFEAAARRLGIADVTAFFPELEAGAEAERETETEADGSTHTEWWAGPSLGFRLPLFDPGRARRTAAAMELRRRWNLLTAEAVEVRSAARRTAARAEHAHRRALYVRDVLLPLRSRITAQTQLRYNAMFAGVFQLLDARRREIEAGRAYVEALADYWLARTDLARLEAGRRPMLEAPAAASGGAPADAGGADDH